MKKSERISSFVAGLEQTPGAAAGLDALDPHYIGYFTCFNERSYYEAHDVLEQLWLRSREPHYAFFKGLIQLAGGFVHLRKQFEQPSHAKHGRRLAPAARLFALALGNLEPFAPAFLHLDVTAVCALAQEMRQALLEGNFALNPWRPEIAPKLQLEPAL